MLAQVYLKVLAISVKNVIAHGTFDDSEVGPIVAAAVLLVVSALTNLFLLNATMKSGKVRLPRTALASPTREAQLEATPATGDHRCSLILITHNRPDHRWIEHLLWRLRCYQCCRFDQVWLWCLYRGDRDHLALDSSVVPANAQTAKRGAKTIRG